MWVRDGGVMQVRADEADEQL